MGIVMVVGVEKPYIVILLIMFVTILLVVYNSNNSVLANPMINSHLEHILLSTYIESQGADPTQLVLSGSGARNGVQASFTVDVEWTTPGFVIGGGIADIHSSLSDRWVGFGTVLGYKESDAWICGPSYDLQEHIDYYFDVTDQGWRYKVEADFHHVVEITNRPFCIFVETEIDHHDYSRVYYPPK